MSFFARITPFRIAPAARSLPGKSQWKFGARNHELAACEMDRHQCCRTLRDRLRWMDCHITAGAVPCRRAADREARGRSHDRGAEAAETQAAADRDHRHQ